MTQNELKVIISESGLTQTEFAHEVGYIPNTIKKYLSGERKIPKDLEDKCKEIMSRPKGTERVQKGYTTVLEGVQDPQSGVQIPPEGVQDPQERVQTSEKGYKKGTPVGSNHEKGTKNHGGSAKVYTSQFGHEWDIMEDGLARGYSARGIYPEDGYAMRRDFRTPGAYFRLIQQETGFDVFTHRVTKKEWDKVNWKKLNLPRYEEIGLKIRGGLR